MKYYYRVLFLLILSLIVIRCSDPLGVEAEREKIVKWDPDSLPPVFEIVPNIIDLGIILPDDSLNYQFYIKNITSHNDTIKSLTLKNNPDHAVFTLPQAPVILKPSSTEGDKVDISMNFHALSIGYFKDTILFEGYNNPKTIVKAELPAVFARDLDFQEKKLFIYSIGIFKIFNRSNVRVTITEFKINDSESIFTNVPTFETPYIINPNSASEDIKITFCPNRETTFVKDIRFKAVFDNPAANTQFPIDTVVVLKGRGIN